MSTILAHLTPSPGSVKVAKRLGYVYIDTGAMYRGVTWKVLRAELDWTDTGAIAELAGYTTIALIPPPDLTGKQHVQVDGHDVTAEIRLPEVSQRVSAVVMHDTPCASVAGAVTGHSAQ